VAGTTREAGQEAAPPARPRPRLGTRSAGAGYWRRAEASWSQGLTVLEAQAVEQGSLKQHLQEWNELLDRVNLTAVQARAHNGNDLDSVVVKQFEKLFFEEEQPTRRMKILGVASHFLRRYCRQGDRGLPRSWRALEEGGENSGRGGQGRPNR